jgi:hypothetical protein
MTTVVLGWDGLDHELTEEFGLSDRFGEYNKQIDTFNNPVMDTPHTRELWPSIITGSSPDEHGVKAATEAEGVDWENSLLNLLSRLSHKGVPEGVRKKVGKKIRNRGAEVSEVSCEYYEENGISTVFDGRSSRAIAIPNYLTEMDEKTSVETDRTHIWNDVLDKGSETSGYKPLVSQERLDELLESLCMKRLGHVRAAVQRDYDIVFCWLAFVDTVGHITPLVDETGWQERMYNEAARMTRSVRDLMSDDDTLVCVSDHGLQNGSHTHSPLLGSDDEDVLENVNSVLDVREGLDRVTVSQGNKETAGIRDGYRYTSETESKSQDEIEGHLEDLGYL